MPLKNKIMKSNYHTHTYLCNHAEGSVEDYVVKAIEFNLKNIGISDHAPFIFLQDRSVRMSIEEYPIYLEELKQAIDKYKDKINIYKGLEIEYFPQQKKHYEELLTHLDYLTLGQHYIESKNKLKSIYHIKEIEDIQIYIKTLIAAMKTGYFKFISHPDIFLFNQKEISGEMLYLSRLLIQAAGKYEVALEINANGIRKGKFTVNKKTRYRYPRKEFWELVKQSNVKTIISSDAHKPKYLFDEAILEAYKFARDIGIEVEEELVMN
ncbi:MAG: histidinol-phosphatase [Candidatus Izemoplasmatales bacterium]|nr:histidinol-phosphatase [Candidatus Izemoplasmatales bacterium]